MRLLIAGLSGPLVPLVRERLMEQGELVQLGGVAPVGVVAAPGSLAEPAAVRDALEGVQTVVCDLLGAQDELCPADETEPDRMSERLCEGLEGLLRQSRAAGARRVVLISSARASALRRTPKKGPLPASALYPWPRLHALRAAEDMALQYGDLSLVLAPAALLGPSLPPSALLSRVLARRAGLALPARPLRLCLADARDVTGAVVSALQRGSTGRRYLLGSSSFWLRTLDERVAERRPPLAPSPPPDNLPVGVLWETVDSALAAAELGWWTRRPGRTLADTLAALDQRAGQGILA